MGEDVKHDVPTEGYGQYTTTTCWYASYRMLHAWKKADESQILPKLKGAGLNVEELKQRGLYGDEFPTAAGALGLAGWRGDFIKSSDADMIMHLLRGYGPLFCAMRYSNGNGHAVVMRGFDAKLKRCLILNPLGTVAGTVDNDYWTFDHFKSMIYEGRFAVQAWF